MGTTTDTETRRRKAGEAAAGSDLASVLPQHDKPWFRVPHLLRLNIFVGVCFLSSTTMGFDGSMMNGLISLDSWNLYFGKPNSKWLGLMNAVLPLGVLLAAFPAAWMSDRWGRRYTIMAGVVVLVVASAIQGASHNLTTFIVSRFLVGVGIEIVSLPAPVLISEIAFPTHRGKATSLYQTSFYLGAICSSWTTFGTFSMGDSTWSWRIPSILQAFFPIIQLVGLFFMPESPRWLISKGRAEEARKFLVTYYAGGEENHPVVEYEMQAISAHILEDKDSASLSWSSLWHTSADRKRLMISIVTAVISQWAGNGIITYYLSLVLDSVGITDGFTKTLINGILQIYNWIMAILGSMCVDRLGRRVLWLISCGGMLLMYIGFSACSAAFENTQSKGVGMTVIVFIFLFFFFYDIAVTPMSFAYPTEILPFHTRQKGVAVTNFSNGVLLMFNSFVNPIALESIGWKYYIVYVVLLFLFLLYAYLFFIETKGHSLEEISDLFDGPWIVASAYRKRIGYEPAQRHHNEGVVEKSTVDTVEKA